MSLKSSQVPGTQPIKPPRCSAKNQSLPISRRTLSRSPFFKTSSHTSVTCGRPARLLIAHRNTCGTSSVLGILQTWPCSSRTRASAVCLSCSLYMTSSGSNRRMNSGSSPCRAFLMKANVSPVGECGLIVTYEINQFPVHCRK